MSHPVWTCKCCSVIFAERVDFERHREECTKRGKACPRCSELFTDVGLNLHLIKSICGLRKYDVEDLRTWANEVNDRRISVCVKDYHKQILDAVTDGKFTIRLPFNYTDDNRQARTDALSKIVSELKKLFTNVVITPDHLGAFIDVAWTKPKRWCLTPDELTCLPELVETHAIKEQMREITLSPRTGFKCGTSLLGKARMGKSTFLNALMSESSDVNYKVPVSDVKHAQEEEEEEEED